MSFTIEKEIVSLLSYPEFGILGASNKETKTITYTAQAISSLVNGQGSAIFGVIIDGVVNSGTFVHEFVYSGQGNPIEEAENSLKEKLEQPE